MEAGVEFEDGSTRVELERAAARLRTSTSDVLARLAKASTGAAEWIEYIALDSGHPYYYNASTGESRWNLPVPESLGLNLDLLREQLADDALLAIEEGEEASDESDDTESSDRSTGDVPALEQSSGDATTHVDQQPLPAIAGPATALPASSSSSANALVVAKDDDEVSREDPEQTERDRRETLLCLTSRNFVSSLIADLLEARAKAWMVSRRDKLREAREHLHKTSHAEFRVNKIVAAAVVVDEVDDEETAEETDQSLLRQRRLARAKEATRLARERRQEELEAAERRAALANVDMDLGDVSEQAMIEALVRNTLRDVRESSSPHTRLRRLSLVDCALTDDDMDQIVEALGQSVVVTVELGKNEITSSGAITLAACASTCLSLRELHLNSNHVGDDGAIALCDAFFAAADRSPSVVPERSDDEKADDDSEDASRVRRVAALQVLNLMANPVGPAGALQFASSLSAAHTSSLRQLRLGGAFLPKAAFKENGLSYLALRERVAGDRGAVALAAALLAPCPHNAIAPRATLTSLSLVSSGIGAAGARAIAAALYCEPPLTHLDLSDNPLEGPCLGAQLPPSSRELVECDASLVPLTPEEQRRGLSVVPRGGVAALARALEATTTLRTFLVSDVPLMQYFERLIRRPPPVDWSRKRELGADAAHSREWLLRMASALHISIAATPLGGAGLGGGGGAWSVPTRRRSSSSSSNVETVRRARGLWLSFLKLQQGPVADARKHDRILSAVEALATCGEIPTEIPWHVLFTATRTLEFVLEVRRDSAAAMMAAASASRAEAQRIDATYFRQCDERAARGRVAAADGTAVEGREAAARQRADETRLVFDRHRDHLESEARRQDSLLQAALAIKAELRRRLDHAADDVHREEERRAKRLAEETQKNETDDDSSDDVPDDGPPTDSERLLALRSTRDAIALQESYASLRVRVLRDARRETDARIARFHATCADVMEAERRATAEAHAFRAADSARVEAERRDRTRHDSVARNAVAFTVTTFAEAQRAQRGADQLRRFLDDVRIAAGERRKETERRDLVPYPTGAVDVDDALAAAKTDQARRRADLAVAEAIVAQSDDFAGAAAAAAANCAVARALCAEADRGVDEAQTDATALALATRPILTETLQSCDSNLVHAAKPRNGLGVAFDVTTVLTAVNRERDRKAAVTAKAELVERRQRQKAADRAELRRLKTLSPRSQLMAIKRQIDDARKEGQPNSLEEIAMRRRLRNYKAKAKEALKKQRREQRSAPPPPPLERLISGTYSVAKNCQARPSSPPSAAQRGPGLERLISGTQPIASNRRPSPDLAVRLARPGVERLMSGTYAIARNCQTRPSSSSSSQQQQERGLPEINLHSRLHERTMSGTQAPARSPSPLAPW